MYFKWPMEITSQPAGRLNRGIEKSFFHQRLAKGSPGSVFIVCPVAGGTVHDVPLSLLANYLTLKGLKEITGNQIHL